MKISKEWPYAPGAFDMKTSEAWPPEGWTIVSRSDEMEGKLYFARHLASGKEGPLRSCYADAMADITLIWAEPWGV